MINLSFYRKLCGKLYFKAEAQQIDRILDVFAKRYWKCNPHSIFGSSGTKVKRCKRKENEQDELT